MSKFINSNSYKRIIHCKKSPLHSHKNNKIKGGFYMGNLKLITTETFNNLSCNFYRNIFDELA